MNTLYILIKLGQAYREIPKDPPDWYDLIPQVDAFGKKWQRIENVYEDLQYVTVINLHKQQLKLEGKYIEDGLYTLRQNKLNLIQPARK